MLNTSTQAADTLHTTLKSARVMQSVRFHGPGDIRVDEVEEPVCGKGQVKMRPAYVGICGSDLHEYTAGPVLIPEHPHPITGSTYPASMGHEFGGIIEEVGSDVTHVSPGQRAVVRPTIYDGTCCACKQGKYHCCENIGFIGLSGFGGGMSQKIVAPAGHFYALPDNVTLEAAALIEPLAVAWHAVAVSPFQPGDSVLVVGGGPIGIGVVQVLALQGAKKIMVAELMDNRKKLCTKYGATDILDPREVDVAQRVHTLTDGVGADIIFDTAGVEGALAGAIPACRAQGAIVNIAVWEKAPVIPVNKLTYNEVRYIGSALYDEGSFLDTIRAISTDQLKPADMITARIALSEVVDKGFQALLDHRDQHCKILVDVQS
ncbi:uncharacterized protein N7482_006465 [Penicillium canariense]|uniref:Enoyl reductase (ER) domain-containing protein n=1 Tax=Penicillium canariense TaxID=189055 RepID=A0A9W9HX96_9EURO|nr:uncharacterized protein N7482_006465 [Penicillium canariense]KAJ5159461.1 hypothetical protein N7482_006465 [Penicillium canariense]